MKALVPDPLARPAISCSGHISVQDGITVIFNKIIFRKGDVLKQGTKRAICLQNQRNRREYRPNCI